MKIAAACKEGLLCTPADAEGYLVFHYQKGTLVGRERLAGVLTADELAAAGVKSIICAGTVPDPAAGLEIFANRCGDPLEALLELLEAGLISDPDLCGGACATCSGCH